MCAGPPLADWWFQGNSTKNNRTTGLRPINGAKVMSIQAVGGASPPIPSPGLVPATPSPASSPAVGSAAVPTNVSTVGGPQASGQLQATQKQAQQLAKALQNAVSPVAQEVEFSVDKASGRTVIKVMDTATDKVIRQIPSEEILSVDQSMDTYQSGMLLKQKA